MTQEYYKLRNLLLNTLVFNDEDYTRIMELVEKLNSVEKEESFVEVLLNGDPDLKLSVMQVAKEFCEADYEAQLDDDWDSPGLLNALYDWEE